MTTILVKIEKNNGSHETVKGYRVNGHFVVTRSTLDKKCWTITHVPSGLSATPYTMGGPTSTMVEASIWGLILSSYLTDWGNVKPSLPNRDTLRVLADRYHKVLGN